METTQCSFCGKDESQIDKMVAGPGVYICNECVQLAGRIIEGGGKPKGISRRFWESMTDDELLASLPKVASVAAQVEDGVQKRVAEARSRGISWARIGQALGMARQSAWERFSGEE
ncbi:hypothetical protein GCM10011575_15980 [Microlunatus endophyticus]|uniref:ClpX-type ZB domain-containing protein n=1 Tax=Microlunatus endophyticus TaxID=1716077 RepID=A0A917S5E2_9ACTN|nr:hypothetical protein GCM10011575_15980 [Microlunatus endophyticus]